MAEPWELGVLLALAGLQTWVAYAVWRWPPPGARGWLVFSFAAGAAWDVLVWIDHAGGPPVFARMAGALDLLANLAILAVPLAAIPMEGGWRRVKRGLILVATAFVVASAVPKPYGPGVPEFSLIVQYSGWCLRSGVLAWWALQPASTTRRAWMLLLVPFSAARWTAEFFGETVRNGLPAGPGAAALRILQLVALMFVLAAIIVLLGTRRRVGGRDRAVTDVALGLILAGFAWGGARAMARWETGTSGPGFLIYSPDIVSILLAAWAVMEFQPATQAARARGAFMRAIVVSSGGLGTMAFALSVVKLPPSASLALAVAAAVAFVPTSTLFVSSSRETGSRQSRPISTRFRVERELGRGTYGRALLAHDSQVDRLVVLKEAHASAARTPEDRDRFLREAKLAGSIDHPNVVRVHEALADEVAPTIVLEYVDGGSLEDLLRAAGPLPRKAAERLALDALSGLAAIHERGIVHRDIKPANILFTGAGTAKICDFGVARAPSNLVPTVGSTTSGTLAYMSPEQARGEPVDARSDLYSLGLVLMEALLGTRPPGPGTESADIDEALADLPPPWAHVLARALARRVQDRYHDAAEMRAAIAGTSF